MYLCPNSPSSLESHILCDQTFWDVYLLAASGQHIQSITEVLQTNRRKGSQTFCFSRRPGSDFLDLRDHFKVVFFFGCQTWVTAVAPLFAVARRSLPVLQPTAFLDCVSKSLYCKTDHFEDLVLGFQNTDHLTTLV